MNDVAALRNRTIRIATALGFLALGFLLGSNTTPAHAEPLAAKVTLGVPASRVLEVDGPPAKIYCGPDVQIWYYLEDSGAIHPRYDLDDGLVVAVRKP